MSLTSPFQDQGGLARHNFPCVSTFDIKIFACEPAGKRLEKSRMGRRVCGIASDGNRTLALKRAIRHCLAAPPGDHNRSNYRTSAKSQGEFRPRSNTWWRIFSAKIRPILSIYAIYKQSIEFGLWLDEAIEIGQGLLKGPLRTLNAFDVGGYSSKSS
jgi:hypothetical protein